ncbi:hypothetical protein MCOR25_010286 [Pyricularia grisea]|nr:hypothetical protein MCOR25_010286 [Pyricularia grisea]
MSYSELHVPGAFHLESPGTPRRPALNADLFRAPVATSPSSSLFSIPKSRSRNNDHPAIPTPASSYSKRRRATPRPSWISSRASAPSHESQTPVSHTPVESSYSALSSSTGYFGNPGSLLTPRETGQKEPYYVLAGHIETPGTNEVEQSALLDDDLGVNHLDVDDRRTMGYNSTISSKRSHCEMEEDPFLTQTLSTPTLRTVARLLYTDVTAPGSPNLLPRWPGNGWTAFAVNTPINIIGKCVGKCWEFVKSSTFAGFQAGSGDTYPVQPTRTGNRMPRRVPSNNDLTGGLGLSNPIVFGNGGGEIHHPDVLRCEKIRDRDPASSPSRPAVKRRQLSGVPRAPEDLQQWVMVDNSNRPGTPGRRFSEYPTGVVRGQSPSRSNIRSSVCQEKRPYPSSEASFPSNYASSTATSYNRRISVPVSRMAVNANSTPSRASSPALNHRPASRVSHAGSATLTSRQPASYATPRSPATPCNAQFSPITTSTPSRLPVASIRTSPNPNAFARPKSTEPETRRQSVSLASPIRTPTNQFDSDSRTMSIASSSSSTCSSASSVRAHRRAHSAVTPSSRRRSLIHGVATKEDKAAVECSSPLISDNSKKILAQRRKQDRDTDARMEALNAQMQAMIRQGKEALGTSFIVEDDDDSDINVPKGASTAGAGAWVDEDDD